MCVICACMRANVPATLLPNVILLVMEGLVDGLSYIYDCTQARAVPAVGGESPG